MSITGFFAYAALMALGSLAATTEDCAGILREGKDAVRESSYDTARGLFEHAAKCFESAQDPKRASSTLMNLGTLLREQGKSQEAGVAFERAYKLLDPDNAPDSTVLASALNNLASYRQQTGNFDEADAMFRRALAIWKTFPGETASTIRTLTNYASMQTAKGDYPSARRTLEHAVSLADAQAYPRDRSAALGQLGILYGKLSEPKAVDLLREALALRETTEGPDSLETAFARNNLGQYLSDHGDLRQAKALIEQGYQGCAGKLGGTTRCAVMLNNLASVDEKLGQPVEAEAKWIKALAQFGPAPLGDLDAFIATSNNLAGHYAAQNKLKQALPLYEGALNVLERRNGQGRAEYAKLLENLGALWMNEKKYDKAYDYLDRARTLDESHFGQYNARLAVDYNNLGVLAARRKHPEEAESFFKKALEIDERNFGPNSAKVAMRLASLGVVSAIRKKYGEAADLYRRAFSIWGDKTGLDSAAEARFLEDYAYCLKKIEDYASAEKIATRALGVRVKAALHGSEKAMF